MNVPHISTGDMLREARAKGTELGKKADAYMQAGALVPDELVNGIVVEKLAGEDGYLLDGFPRTIAQADALEKAGEKIDAVILIDVADDILISRITGRLSCPKCGSVYHKINMPPANEGICDRCLGPLVQRADDNETTVRQRLDAYHAQTQPLVDYYEKRGLLTRIDGAAPLEEGFQAIKKALEF
jgi:adenylate kinase